MKEGIRYPYYGIWKQMYLHWIERI